MPDWRVLHGNALSLLSELPTKSVHMICTSPPYWGLRDYGVLGQLGLEPTPELYVEHMVAVFREVRRVLRKDGTLWLNMGDSYASQPGKGDNVPQTKWPVHGYPNGAGHRSQVIAGLKPKDLVGMPWMLAFALRADGWWLRSEIIWAKPNPMPESVGDRPTKAHEQVFLLTKAQTYYYDADAVREPAQYGYREHTGEMRSMAQDGRRHTTGTTKGGDPSAGRNLRSVWSIATQPFPEAHFATFPEALVEPCIKAGTSEKGCCPECGAPWVRMNIGERLNGAKTGNPQTSIGLHRNGGNAEGSPPVTLGWHPTCRHDAEPVPCTVLDPFAGSGTVGVVALRLGRSFVGIELNPQYVEMARRRITNDAPLFNTVTA